MKTKSLLLMCAVGLFGMKVNAQDLAPGINYSYNPPAADGIITSITVDVVENSGTPASNFSVAMYLYDMASSTPYVIGTTSVASISGYGVVTISNWNIDINNTPGIPAGTYRLGIWVDSNNDISESDENNNTGLLAGNINYNPNASGIATAQIAIGAINLFPNPSNENATVNYSVTENSTISIKIYDVTGKQVAVVSENENCLSGDYIQQISTSNLPSGVYYLTLSTGELSVARRLMVAH